MMVICSVLIALSVGDIVIVNDIAVEGKVLSAGEGKYLIDFSEDLKTRKGLAGKPADYTKVLVDKDKCVPLK